MEYLNIFEFQCFFEIWVDGKVKAKVENKNPRKFNNVTLWAARSQDINLYPPSDAVIRSLSYGLDTSEFTWLLV